MIDIDVLIIGAGPAGLSAAIRLGTLGIDTLVVDEQASPGGQIWRMAEARAALPEAAVFGDEYRLGADVIAQFRRCGARYLAQTEVWHIEEGWRSFATRRGSDGDRVIVIRSRCVILATGALERPVSFPGCTLPGVLTVGAAQILLKTSGMVSREPVWIAASGPLPLLYMHQLLRAGGRIAGVLQTTTKRHALRALRQLPRAAPAWRQMAQGMLWQYRIAGAVPIVRHVSSLVAEGEGRLVFIKYETHAGERGTINASVLLTHEGLVPNLYAGLSVGCEHRWCDSQLSLLPTLDRWGESSRPGMFIVGDGARIGGAEAARVSGEITACGVARRLGKRLSVSDADKLEQARRSLKRTLSIRPFLDAWYRPRDEILSPAEAAIVCRCEVVSAAQIRQAIKAGATGFNQLKGCTRVGMGPCQGRQCGHIVANLLAEMLDVPASQVGYFHVRPPLKPLTLGELAHVNPGIQDDC